MKSLKKKIKNLIGSDVIYIVRYIKNNVLPSQEYLEELNDNEKRKSFYSQFINKGDLCFDVGANAGNRVTPLLALGAKIIAFEPQSSCVNILKWKFGKKIVIVQEALGSQPEVKELHISNFSGLSSLSEEWINSVKDTRFKNFEWSESEKVKVNTLDNAIKTYGLPKFIKIDVEGYEPEVLHGLTTPVELISFEYATPEQTENVIKCINRISQINPNTTFNYSVGESMVLALSQWVSVKEMLTIVQDQSFINTQFGDIYARSEVGKQNES